MSKTRIANQRPLVGITGELAEGDINGRPWHTVRLLESYFTGLELAGALPIMLPLANDRLLGGYLDRLDGIVLSGGVPDIPGDALGEPQHPASQPMPIRRWHSECAWLKAAIDYGLPTLGICLGMQVMNVMSGGGMVQDIPDQLPDADPHAGSDRMLQHEVQIESGSRLAEYAPAARVTITSSHHQAVRNIQAPYRACAHSQDGLIEAIEDPNRPFLIGVQWHPERSHTQPDWLLQAFTNQCAEYRTAQSETQSVL